MVPSAQIWNEVFQVVDSRWLDLAKDCRYDDGSTALCVALDGADLVVANCGDCRALLVQGGQTVVLTRDHKPTDEEESKRIVSQGGTIIGGRLQGQLGVSRAFGNYEFKESQVLSAEPEINHVTLTVDSEYLVIGSDGLYEQFTNEEIISFIKNGIVNANLETVIAELVEEAIDRGCADNITIIVVKFDQSYKKLLKKREKKQSSKALIGKNLRTSGKTSSKITPPASPPPEQTGLTKGLGLHTSGKTITLTLKDQNPELPTQKKKPESKKPKSLLKTNSLAKPPSPREKPNEEEKLSLFYKAFKHDFFNRTPVTISG